MALFNVIKDKFDSERNNLEQAKLAIWFQNQLLTAAKMAGNNLGMLDVDGAGKFGLKLEERFNNESSKSHRFYRASAGSTIERLTYLYLLSATCAVNLEGVEVEIGKMPEKVAGIYKGELMNKNLIFALEYTGSSTELPSKFSHSRPDIRLSLGEGPNGDYAEALFDLTSEAQKDHVLKKGDNWLSKTAIPYISEIIWTNNDIMLKD